MNQSRYPMSNRLPTTKELDFILLAACSCLLAVLQHPIAEALSDHSSELSANLPIPTAVTGEDFGQVLKNDLYSLGLTVKTSRDIFAVD